MTKLQERVLEQMRADYDVIGEQYLKGQEEIERLQNELASTIKGLWRENDRMRIALLNIIDAVDDMRLVDRLAECERLAVVALRPELAGLALSNGDR